MSHWYICDTRVSSLGTFSNLPSISRKVRNSADLTNDKIPCERNFAGQFLSCDYFGGFKGFRKIGSVFSERIKEFYEFIIMFSITNTDRPGAAISRNTEKIFVIRSFQKKSTCQSLSNNELCSVI